MNLEPTVMDSAPEAWCVESIRKAKGISLDEIAIETKLKLATLQAIEAGDFSSLPGGIYNVSFIRQYARAIGVDEAPLVQTYRARFSPVTEQEGACQPVLQLFQARPPE